MDINAYIRAVAPLRRDARRIGPFLATCTASSDNLFLNYAVPDNGADPSAEEVTALIEGYESRHRTARLEYMPGMAPLVEPALLAAGFQIEGRLPVMVFDRAATRLAAPDEIRIRRPVTVADTRGMLEVQAEAYRGPRPSDADVRRQREETDIESRALIAEDARLGVVVGAGSGAPVVEAMAEDLPSSIAGPPGLRYASTSPVAASGSARDGPSLIASQGRGPATGPPVRPR